METAWLGCAIGNSRAARFYEKSGWHLARSVVEQLETPGGPFPLELWRYEKRLPSGPALTDQRRSAVACCVRRRRPSRVRWRARVRDPAAVWNPAVDWPG